MKISITGPNGLIGKALVSRGCTPLSCDVTNPAQVQHDIKYQHPDLIVHLAAKSGVNFCQRKENDQIVSKTNLRGAYNVFDAANGIPVVFVSSDHIFDGKAWFPYKENAKPNPINQYGLSKYCAEQMAMTFDNVKIVRSSTVFSWKREMIQEYLEKSYRALISYAPSFLKRSFVYLDHFAECLLTYVEEFENMPKILNIAGSDTVSWYVFARALVERSGYNYDLVEKRNHEISDDVAPRARRLGLNTELSQSLGIPQYDYKDGLDLMWSDYRAGRI